MKIRVNEIYWEGSYLKAFIQMKKCKNRPINYGIAVVTNKLINFCGNI